MRDLRFFNDRIERPFRAGAAASAVVVAFFVVGGWAYLKGLLQPIESILGHILPLDWRVFAGGAVLLTTICFAYAYLGHRVGIARANLIMTALLFPPLLAFVWYVTTRF